MASPLACGCLIPHRAKPQPRWEEGGTMEGRVGKEGRGENEKERVTLRVEEEEDGEEQVEGKRLVVGEEGRNKGMSACFISDFP